MGSAVCAHCQAELTESTERRRFCSSRSRAAALQRQRKDDLALAEEHLARALARLRRCRPKPRSTGLDTPGRHA